MGWNFRRSVSFGPVRVNLSKSGVGYSVGAPGFRVGMRASGRKYSRVSIPGTGIYYTPSTSTSNAPARSGCAIVLLVIGAAGLTRILFL